MLWVLLYLLLHQSLGFTALLFLSGESGEFQNISWPDFAHRYFTCTFLLVIAPKLGVYCLTLVADLKI